MKNLRLFILIILCSCNFCCDKNPFAKHVWRIIVRNQSSQRIGFIYPEYDRKTKQILNIHLFPDTSLVEKEPSPMINVPTSDERYIDFPQDFDEVFEAIPSGKLSIYIFSEDTLKKYSWEEIRQGYKVLKRYDLTHAELDQMDYTIVYQ